MIRHSRLGFAAFVLACTMAPEGAQQPATANAYVNSQYLISLHPSYPEIVALQERIGAELGALNQQARELMERSQAGGLSPDDQEALNVTLVTLESMSQQFDEELGRLLQPVLLEITEAIATVAEANGIGMVFDYGVASESGLIVYADPSTDLTALVEAQLSCSN